MKTIYLIGSLVTGLGFTWNASSVYAAGPVSGGGAHSSGAATSGGTRGGSAAGARSSGAAQGNNAPSSSGSNGASGGTQTQEGSSFPQVGGAAPSPDGSPITEGQALDRQSQILFPSPAPADQRGIPVMSPVMQATPENTEPETQISPVPMEEGINQDESEPDPPPEEEDNHRP